MAKESTETEPLPPGNYHYAIMLTNGAVKHANTLDDEFALGNVGVEEADDAVNKAMVIVAAKDEWNIRLTNGRRN